jgi:type II secretory pathway pseudopilin PulG
VQSRIREEAGIGLIELLVAMTVMAIGIFALVAGFSSGHVTLQRAGSASSAGSVADKEMERYRALKYLVMPTPTCLAATCPVTVSFPTAGDGRTYRMEVSIGYACPVGTLGGTVALPTCTSPTADPTKLVKIVVKDKDNTKTLFRQSSSFAKKSTG